MQFWIPYSFYILCIGITVTTSSRDELLPRTKAVHDWNHGQEVGNTISAPPDWNRKRTRWKGMTITEKSKEVGQKIY